MLTKAFANMPAGHGKFNFEEIGKRSDNSIDTFDENNRLFLSELD